MKKKMPVIIIAVVTAVSIAACGSPSASTSTSASNTKETSTSSTKTTASYATLDAYNQVKEGMTLDEVNKIFGFDGTQAAAGSAEVGSVSSTAEVYTWAGEAPGSTASISFQDGKVVAVAQAGLK